MRTALFEKHQALGAKMVDFAGWEMPVQYQGLIEEHQAVRNGVGIFDVSHMGIIHVEGPGAEALLDYLSTNRIVGKEDGMATYTVWPNQDGGCVDDVIVFRLNQEHFFVVANASNREKDLLHLSAHGADFDVTIYDSFSDYGILAVQGPKATPLVTSLFPKSSDLKMMRVCESEYKGIPVYLSTTGYTGSGGFELMAPNRVITDLWDSLMTQGAGYGIQPIGLGARDTLRMEMGYALYGHELSDSIAANESVSSWTIRLKNHDFLGRPHIMDLKESGSHRRPYGVVLMDRGIAREGYEVFQGDDCIGVVTSGTRSPSLQQSIAILLVDRELQEGDEVQIQIRKQRAKAKVVNMPFLDPKKMIM